MGCSEAKIKETPFRKGVLDEDASGGFHKSHRLLRKLGQGSYSSVYLARPKGCRNVEHAVKVFDLSASSDRYEESKQRLEAVRMEAEMLKVLFGERHCVQFVDFYEEDRLSYIVMEKCEHSLPRALEEVDSLTVPVVANCIQQMLQGLSRVHTSGIVHRDVKPANFLVSGVVGRSHVIKLCDFGLAVTVPGGPGNTTALWDVCGTTPFCAPEMLNFSGYGTRADMWSFGTVVYLLLLGQYVYMPRPLSLQRIKVSIQEDCPKPTFSSAPGLGTAHITPSSVAFLQALLNRDPSKRVSANKAIKLDWLRFGARHCPCSPRKGQQLQTGPGSPRKGQQLQTSLKPMLEAAKKLGAFNSDDRAGVTTSLDMALHGLQAQHGNVLPLVGRE